MCIEINSISPNYVCRRLFVLRGFTPHLLHCLAGRFTRLEAMPALQSILMVERLFPKRGDIINYFKAGPTGPA